MTGGQSPSGLNRGMITVAVILASFLQSLDTTIANVALPHVQGSLAATPEEITWVLTSYIVAAAIMIPLSGWLADRFGRKLVLTTSVVGFTLASALCGVAQSLGQIVLFRLLQGLCGAALVPQSQAILLDINPPERHGRAMAVWGMAVVFGPVIGPVLGGWLTDNYSWRWVFYINVPFGVLSFLGLAAFLGESRGARKRFDFFGFITLSLAIGALQLMLDRGQLLDWFNSREICFEAGVGALAFYLFLVQTFTSPAPFVSPHLFQDRSFAVSNVVIFVFGAVLFATLALLPPLLQELMGYPVTTTGLVTAPRGVGTLLSMIAVGRLIGRVDTRLITGAGIGLIGISMWQMSGFSPQMGAQPVIWSGFVQGIGVGFTYVPLSTVCFATLAPRYRSEGASIFNLLRNIGSSIGISSVQALLVRNTQILHASLADRITPFADRLRPPALYGPSLTHGLAALNTAVTRQAEWIAFLDDFKLMFLLTVACLPLLLLLNTGRPAAGAPVALE